MADEQEQEQEPVEGLEEDLGRREDPDGERIEGGAERREHLTEDPTPPPAEEAPEHVESQ